MIPQHLESKFMWASLSGTLAQFYMRHGTLDDIIHKVGLMLYTADDKTHNECVGLLIDKEYTVQMSVTVMVIWSRLYEVKFSAHSLPNYNRWHELYDKYILPDVKVSPEDGIIRDEVQKIIKLNSAELYNRFKQR